MQTTGNDIYWGILTIMICGIGYILSWKFQARDNFKFAILLLMSCGLLLRLYTACDFFLHPWDERYHALVAKHMIQHPLIPMLYEQTLLPYRYTEWTINHVWLHKQPLPLWTMAVSMKLFGVNEIALRLPSIFLTTIGIYLTFHIGKFFYNARAGYIAALLYSVNGFVIDLASGRGTTDHIDIFFLAFIQLSIFFAVLYVQKSRVTWNILSGVSLGAAILSKWLPALIVLPMWLLITIDSKKFNIKTITRQFFVLIFVTAIVTLPWQLYIFHTFPSEAHWEAAYNFRHITDIVESHKKPIYFYFDTIRIDYGELVYIPLLWFIWSYYKNLQNLKLAALFVWWFIPILFFTFVKTKMGGYILFTAPAFFVITGAFCTELPKWRYNSRAAIWLGRAFPILVILLAARYAIERTKPFNNINRQPEWVKELKKLNNMKIKNGVLFNYNNPIDAMFYTNLTAYESLPDTAIIKNLVSHGYTVIINDKNVPVEVSTIQKIKLINLLTP
jgi:4-amino-4-deoxy-L-arabinose transferase-like glycosyltransferase